MDTGVLAFGLGSLAVGIGFLVVARRLYPRFDVPEDVRKSLRLVTAVIAAILVVTGLALIVVGAVSSSAMG